MAALIDRCAGPGRACYLVGILPNLTGLQFRLAGSRENRFDLFAEFLWGQGDLSLFSPSLFAAVEATPDIPCPSVLPKVENAPPLMAVIAVVVSHAKTSQLTPQTTCHDRGRPSGDTFRRPFRNLALAVNERSDTRRGL